MSRILVHFSCGAASAVAWKVTQMRYGNEAEVEAVYCDLSKDEHEDNGRFLADVERWVGRPVKKLRHPKYSSVDDVFVGVRYVVGPAGAACTRILKREVREAYQRPDDRHVIGYTADERDRIDRFENNNPDLGYLWVLADAGITKEDCYHILTSHGIELPVMYKLGFNNNNCIACVKGGKGYQNKIRRHFPEVFAKRAAVLRHLGVQLNSGGKLYWLDELDPNEGNDVPEPPIDCGVFCERYADLVK